jgi:HSP20 family protein
MEKKGPWRFLPVRLSQEVDRLFEELIYRPWGIGHSAAEEWSPDLDLYETEAAFILEADLPGVRKEEVSVEVENDELVLKGERAFQRETTSGSFHYSERRAGHFVRRLRLPASVNRDEIRAEFNKGVLRVTLPRVAEKRPSAGARRPSPSGTRKEG